MAVAGMFFYGYFNSMDIKPTDRGMLAFEIDRVTPVASSGDSIESQESKPTA